MVLELQVTGVRERRRPPAYLWGMGFSLGAVITKGCYQDEYNRGTLAQEGCDGTG